ncbi:MAG: SDR family oxidoreductase [Planctomycetota bacterium]
MTLQGKNVLIAGGGSGIGLGIAQALLSEGCRVAVTGRTEETLRAVAEATPALRFRTCDVSDRAQVAALFDWFHEELGPLAILVNSAGINTKRRSTAELSGEDWDRILAINTTGAFNCVQAALPEMRERRDGLIVNIGSISGKRALKLAGMAYSASKFAMDALGTAVRLEEAVNGIRVTNIHPGEVATPILKQRPVPVPPERIAQMLQPEDLGALVVAIAKLPPRAVVPELIITPLYQEYA